MSRRTAALFLPIAVAAFATMGGGCGQKGPLYLPDATPPAAETAPRDVPAEDEDDDGADRGG